MCSKISARLEYAYASYSDFFKVCEMIRKKKEKKNQDIFMKICRLISREWLEGSDSNLECGLPCMEANSTVNLVLFEVDITKLVPVNVLTPFACAPFSWAAQHIIMSLDIRTLQ